MNSGDSRWRRALKASSDFRWRRALKVSGDFRSRRALKVSGDSLQRTAKVSDDSRWRRALKNSADSRWQRAARLSLVLGILLVSGTLPAWADDPPTRSGSEIPDDDLPQRTAQTNPSDSLRVWWDAMSSLLDTMGAAHRIVPPKPVKVRWRARLIWNGKVSGEVLDVIAADLGGDTKSELLVLTTTSLLVLSRSRGLFDIRNQVTLAGKPASIRPRDPIGSMSVSVDDTGVAIWVRSSEKAMAELYRYMGGELIAESERAGYPLCHEGTIYAHPGRNTFHGKTASFAPGKSYGLAQSLYSARCSHNEVDPTGHAVEYLSEVTASGSLRLQCSGNTEFCAAAKREYQGVGVAHLVVDVNHDGFPEVVTSGADMSTPGDSVVVYSQKSHGQRLIYDKSFTSGIAAIASGDFDGDGTQEIVVTVRKRGTNRMTLWLLN